MKANQGDSRWAISTARIGNAQLSHASEGRCSLWGVCDDKDGTPEDGSAPRALFHRWLAIIVLLQARGHGGDQAAAVAALG